MHQINLKRVTLLHRIRFLFQGWKRFSVLFQILLWSVLMVCLLWIGIRGLWIKDFCQGRIAFGFYFTAILAMIFFLNRNQSKYVRGMGFLALGWTTFLWLETLLPGNLIPFLRLSFLKKIGWDHFTLLSFSLISLFGLGYPFTWMGRKRIWMMISGGFMISIMGFLLLGRITILERSSFYFCTPDLVAGSIFIIVVGGVILGRGVQDCLEKGDTYWSFVPYAAAAAMFLLTMTLWSSFQIHEQRSWTRELETFTAKLGDKFEQRLVSLSQNLERFCLMVSLRDKIKLDEWRVETKTLMDHEDAILGFERFPGFPQEWSVQRRQEGENFRGLSSESLNVTVESSQRNRMVWMTSPFLISKNQKGLGLVYVVEMKGQKPWWMVMGLDFNVICSQIFSEEGEQVYTKVMAEEAILKDYEGDVRSIRENPFLSEFYFHGINFKVMVLPKAEFFIRRDQFLSIGFLVAGFCFSILFGTLVGLYIQTHWDSLKMRGVNEQLGSEIMDRRKAEETTEQKNKDLETLIYVVSHDLREPLRGIESFSRLIYERYLERLDEKGQDFLRRIVFSSMRLDRLLDDITTLSRVQRAEFPSAPVNAREMVMEALGRLETAIKAKSASIDIERDLPALWVNRTWGTQ
ncbi:MAG: histidine kinase dimerization/phospho-acceptor domain-containing protein, partial [Verrucomicrobiota bacterium]